MIVPHSLYLASWEHLYLSPDGLPAGLPNQIFAKSPWAIILFEKLYCDENGLRGEDNAARLLGWTNSRLFVRLVQEDVLEPLPVEAHLAMASRRLRAIFTDHTGTTPEEAANAETMPVEEFFAWRTELLREFLAKNRLLLYDFELFSGLWPILDALEDLAKDLLIFEIENVPLTVSPGSLSGHLRNLFDDLQRFEKEPLTRLRTGVLPQLQYLEILRNRASDYALIDAELSQGVEERLQRILLLRHRFGNSDGWKSVRSLLAAHHRGALPEELTELQHEVRRKLDDCFKPAVGEFGRGLIEIGKGLLSLNPAVHKVEVANKVRVGARELRRPYRDLLQWIRRRSASK
ncbi:MAG: hypothetical protein GY835_05010 [bacterium]|nr:hypothetical protein [bacterium]